MAKPPLLWWPRAARRLALLLPVPGAMNDTRQCNSQYGRPVPRRPDSGTIATAHVSLPSAGTTIGGGRCGPRPRLALPVTSTGEDPHEAMQPATELYSHFNFRAGPSRSCRVRSAQHPPACRRDCSRAGQLLRIHLSLESIPGTLPGRPDESTTMPA